MNENVIPKLLILLIVVLIVSLNEIDQGVQIIRSKEVHAVGVIR